MIKQSSLRVVLACDAGRWPYIKYETINKHPQKHQSVKERLLVESSTHLPYSFIGYLIHRFIYIWSTGYLIRKFCCKHPFRGSNFKPMDRDIINDSYLVDMYALLKTPSLYCYCISFNLGCITFVRFPNMGHSSYLGVFCVFTLLSSMGTRIKKDCDSDDCKSSYVAQCYSSNRLLS